jgi:hypothetical protein
MKRMNNLKFIEVTNESHPRLTVSASVALARESSAIADPFFAVPATGEASFTAADKVGSMGTDTVSGERKQK